MANRIPSTMLMAIALCGITSTAFGEAPVRGLLLERDTIQTRNFNPVINHEVMVGNCTDKAFHVDVVSPIAAGCDVAGDFVPAFGYDSALSVPMQCPWPVDIRTFNLNTDTPRHTKEGGGKPPAFEWSGVRVGPREAVVFQYDNHLGSPGMFNEGTGFDIAGLKVAERHRVGKAGDGKPEVPVTLDYSFTNATGFVIHDLGVRVFMPHSLLSSLGDSAMVATELVGGPSALEAGGSVMSDGNGRLAAGNDFYLPPRALGVDETLHVVIRLNMKPLLGGELHPTILIQGRGEGNRIWPATLVTAEPNLGFSSFHYRMWNIVLPGRSRFIVKPPGSIVVSGR